eukprot:5076263-Amphidinium_carterae.1
MDVECQNRIDIEDEDDDQYGEAEQIAAEERNGMALAVTRRTEGGESTSKRRKPQQAYELKDVMEAIGDLNLSMSRRLDTMQGELRSVSSKQQQLETDFRNYSQRVEDRFSTMEARIKALEDRPATSQADTSNGATSEEHIAILGGWPQDSKRSRLEQDYTTHLQGKLCAVDKFAPKKRGTIMVLKYSSDANMRKDIAYLRANRNAVPGLELWAAKSRPKSDRDRRSQISKMLRTLRQHLPNGMDSDLAEAEFEPGILYFDDRRLCQRDGVVWKWHEEHWEEKFGSTYKDILEQVKRSAVV